MQHQSNACNTVQRADPEQERFRATPDYTGPATDRNASVSQHSAPMSHQTPVTMSRSCHAAPEQHTDLQDDKSLMDHVSDKGDESSASGVEVDNEAEQKEDVHQSASVEKATLTPVGDNMTIADSLPTEDTSDPIPEKKGMTP